MRIVSFTQSQQPEYVAPLIACYQEVFRAPPWNEEWWTDALVRAELDQYDHDRAASVLAITDGRVVGFLWGGVFPLSELESELGVTLPRLYGEVLYIKDIGVSAAYRQRGIATQLLAPLVQQLANIAHAPCFIGARTMGPPAPSVVYDWFQREYGFTVAAHYGGNDNRVILAQNYDRFIERV